MEGFELLSTGAWSILPPLLALGLALITRGGVFLPAGWRVLRPDHLRVLP